MKKTLAFFLAALLSLGCLTGCGGPSGQEGQKGETLHVVTTIFPIYDWVEHVLGDNPGGVEVTMLLDTGVDLHSYQPTAQDILRLATCDLFLYVGGESDEWVEDALQEAVNQDMVVLNLLELLGDAAKEEELVEGMEAEDAEEEEGTYDEHVWLSLRNAELLTQNIEEALKTLDPEHAAAYGQSASDYREQLEALDLQYQEAVAQGSYHTLLFGDRFPFRYLADDYNLDYYAAFAGCSAETEASFETVTFLAKKVDELSLPAVLTIEGTNHKIAETIVQNTQTKDQKILTLDSLQSTTAKDLQEGVTYLEVMENNLTVLREALS